MASKGKQLSELLDANGDVLQSNLDNIVVNATSVSDTPNTSTGYFALPSGTSAQRPGSPQNGWQRWNTDDNRAEIYKASASAWVPLDAVDVSLSSVTGTLYTGLETTLTLSGTGFLTANLDVNFTPSGGSTTTVTVTPTSDTAATVTVPSAIYSAVSAGTVVAISVTNEDNSTSLVTNKTMIAAPTGGDTITISGGYRIHEFTQSGNFVLATNDSKSVEYLVIAGGGAGTSAYGGAGGAGGYRSSVSGESSGGGASAESPLSLTAGSYSVQVGAGGTGYASNQAGGQGTNSIFHTITSLGGGRGGTGAGNGTVGGSGGGGNGSGAGGSSGTIAGGAGTSGQGYAGGVGRSSGTNPTGGGGGGAGGTGGNSPSTGNGGIGGIGVASSITGTSVYRAGGGGGGDNVNQTGTAQHGGGSGGYQGATDGTDGTGGGGGGSYSSAFKSGDGGDGIVIIRYAI